jgi:hypothetical protein
LFILGKQVGKLKENLGLYQSSINDKGEEMAYLNNELTKIQSLIDKIKNGEDYQKITKIAEQEDTRKCISCRQEVSSFLTHTHKHKQVYDSLIAEYRALFNAYSNNISWKEFLVKKIVWK